MLTRTGEYAMRAMVCLAQNQKNWPMTAPQIAAETGIPQKYLSMILATLVRQGVLTATRGKGGGFRMVPAFNQVSLADILGPFEPNLSPHRDKPCPFGNPVCSDTDPCAGHDGWKRLSESYLHFLQKTTLQEVAMKKSKKRSGKTVRGRKSGRGI